MARSSVHYLDLPVAAQARQRLVDAPSATVPTVFDRSSVCALALCRWLGHPVSPTLAAEISRLVEGGDDVQDVFYVQSPGHVERTAARRISDEDALVFGELHRTTYRELGFRLVDVPVLPVPERVDLVEAVIRKWMG